MKSLTKYQRKKLRDKIDQLGWVIDDCQNEIDEILKQLKADTERKRKKKKPCTSY